MNSCVVHCGKAYSSTRPQLRTPQGEKRIITQDALGRIVGVLAQDANNQKISEVTYTYSPENNSVTETIESVSTTTTFDAFGNPVPVEQVDSEEGIGTQIWNATLGNPRVQGGLMFAGGIVEILGKAALWLASNPTLLTKIGGGATLAAQQLTQNRTCKTTNTNSNSFRIANNGRKWCF